jgi:hypothetical protein
MPKYLIEREIPCIGHMSPEALQAASRKSVCALDNLGPKIQWQQSYVTDNRLYCVYIAANEELIRAHANESSFPATRICEIKTMIDPTTAEE